MESPQRNSKINSNRENECRFCLKATKTRINLTKILKKKFLELTQTELQLCDKLSNFICSKCAKQFKSAHSYREKLIQTQNNLLEEVAQNFMPELINLKQEKIEIEEFEEVDGLDSRTEVKQELEDTKELDLDDNLFEDYEALSFDDSVTVEDEVKEKDQEEKASDFKCEHIGCEEVLPNKTKLKIHMKKHKPPRRKDKSAMCSYCGVKLCSKWSLHKHVASVHLKAQNYFCDICGYVAAIRCLIRSHIKTHLDISERKMYKCKSCEFQSMSLASLKRHELNEHEGMTFACHCGKIFRYQAALQAHVKVVHLKLKNHACDCGKKFYSRVDLNDHQIVSHGKSTPLEFSCDQCDKRFPTRKQLMRHKPYHTEAKFTCTYHGCDKSYITEQKLARHMKTHVGERDLQCHLCDKAYFFTKDLQRHLDVAHKQTTFFCELCAFTNNRKDYLSNHIKASHGHISQQERNKMVARAKFVRNSI
ncbi:unnamed protein product [Chironomus riparius]|uniref:Uncharacterized protein n=1 Tax=Chironomus riparius TaxID=315576 RepID=A0A9N9S888_9DIPT|nr:unnamed protein product [Chironomus riparius]